MAAPAAPERGHPRPRHGGRGRPSDVCRAPVPRIHVGGPRARPVGQHGVLPPDGLRYPSQPVLPRRPRADPPGCHRSPGAHPRLPPRRGRAPVAARAGPLLPAAAGPVHRSLHPPHHRPFQEVRGKYRGPRVPVGGGGRARGVRARVGPHGRPLCRGAGCRHPRQSSVPRACTGARGDGAALRRRGPGVGRLAPFDKRRRGGHLCRPRWLHFTAGVACHGGGGGGCEPGPRGGVVVRARAVGRGAAAGPGRMPPLSRARRPLRRGPGGCCHSARASSRHRRRPLGRAGRCLPLAHPDWRG
mmetsp:Transcript_60938/g.193299  ORF Transcript_60938/g.193299 Transcript_60938/m.193299 type:complete len:300 (+) Transcript_60938:813-1712(+)